jgi:hypothetical protein
MESGGRNRILERLEVDLVGPFEKEEVIESRPSDLYLTGILWPRQTQISPEEDEKLEAEQSTGNTEEALSAEEEEVSKRGLFRPSSAGLSFAVESGDGEPSIRISVSFATYAPLEDEQVDIKGEGTARQKRRSLRWQRTEYHFPDIRYEIRNAENPRRIGLEKFGAPSGVEINVRAIPWEGRSLATVTLLNNQFVEEGSGRDFAEKSTLFQTRIVVRPDGETGLIARPSRRPIVDEDDRTNALLYRQAREFAVGHTCSASWEESGKPGFADAVFTEWIPKAMVSHINPDGHECFRELDALDDTDPLSAEWLSNAKDGQFQNALEKIPSVYGKWLDIQEGKNDGLPEEFRNQALQNLDQCRKVQERMLEGAKQIANNPEKRTAFRLANAAISLQHGWNKQKNQQGNFRWRPFQMGFLLLASNSTVDDAHQDRDVMDLLWFPTGGGKTEAYLGLIAYLLFYRRLSARGGSLLRDKPRVNAIMRYTLRTLTAQQFERAASLILACEVIRRYGKQKGETPDLGNEPFSIGLWVGGDATPNKCKDVPDNLMQTAGKTPVQILECPACGEKISWEKINKGNCVEARCTNRKCPLFHEKDPLPIWTVDEDVYRHKPSLVIGTVDKFAQIVRKAELRDFFCIADYPPDLVIQDELHLISGPLGTLAGLYEVAIDKLFYSPWGKPKIIGSTATIRRASEQVQALFDRTTCQFPPQAIDADDSGFAVKNENAPGRIYAAVTTAGRSAKFALQALCASLLQSAKCGVMETERDPYWTLVGYFNSIRELGGAVVLMEDDVRKSMELIAEMRDEGIRHIAPPEEMTSRRTQAEIRDLLQNLGVSASEEGAIDVLLATNMLSVGVDIPRLGLMVVNGQPKGISEYIQATSRVGRGAVPGLVISLLNNLKPRDRSHYESFRTWHSSLYRDVEVTSVTPFASRARDKALHAVLVALVRHLVPGMQESPDPGLMGNEILEDLLSYVTRRARSVDPEELEVRSELENIIEEWKLKTPSFYWNQRKPNESLLQDAEKAAAASVAGYSLYSAWPTPNNMRSVEPSTKFFLKG